MSHANRDSISAYYIAEAGANLAYEDMKSIVEEMYHPDINQDTFFEAIEEKFESEISTYNKFKTQFGYQPKANISIFSPDDDVNPRVYTIESVSNIRNHSRIAQKKVTVNWDETQADGENSLVPNIPTNATLISNSYLNVAGNKVVGGIYINSSTENSAQLDYTDVSQAIFYNTPGSDPNLIIDFHDWNKPTIEEMNETLNWEEYIKFVGTFPAIPEYPPSDEDNNINLSGGAAPKLIPLVQNVSYNNIELNNNRVLRFDTADSNRSITIENLTMNNGHIEVLGDGTLTIYIKNSMTFGSSSSINRKGDSSRVKIYYAGSSDVRFSGNQLVKGSIFIDHAKLFAQGSSGVEGFIVTGGPNVYFDGGTHSSPMIFAPKAYVELKAGSNFNGTIVGETISITGGTEVTHQPFIKEHFPFGSSVPSERPKPSIDDLINAEPTKEPR